MIEIVVCILAGSVALLAIVGSIYILHDLFDGRKK